MLKVNRNSIYLTRGDTAYITVTLTDYKGKAYEWQDGDRLFLRVKQSPTTLSVLLEKKIISGETTFEITEADTENFEFGSYRYEVELVTAGGQHFTVIENSIFEIGPELENH